jgi:hypothetical protein
MFLAQDRSKSALLICGVLSFFVFQIDIPQGIILEG